MKATLQPFTVRTTATLTASRAPLSPIALALVSGSTYRLYDGLGRVSTQAPKQIRERGGRPLSPSQRRQLAPVDCPVPADLVPPDGNLRPELAVMASPTLTVVGGLRNGRVLAPAEYSAGAFTSTGDLPLTVSEFPAAVGVVRGYPEGVVTYAADPVLTISGSWEDGGGLSKGATNYQLNGSNLAAWYVRGTATRATGITDPDGGSGAVQLTLGTSGNDCYYDSATTMGADGQSVRAEIVIKRISTAGTLTIQSARNASYGRWSVDLSKLSGSWERIHASHPAVTVAIPFSTFSGMAGTHMFASSGNVTAQVWRVSQTLGTSGGRIIPVPGLSPVTRADYTYSSATGIVDLLGVPLASGATLLSGGQACTQIDATHWQTPPTSGATTEQDLTGWTYTAATGSLTTPAIKAGTTVYADNIPCTGSGSAWTVAPLNTGTLTWTDAPEGCTLRHDGGLSYTLVAPAASPDALAGWSALAWTADPKTGKGMWLPCPTIQPNTLYKATLDIELLEPGPFPTYGPAGVRFWLSGQVPNHGTCEVIPDPTNPLKARLQITGASVAVPTGKIGWYRADTSIRLRSARWLVEEQETGTPVFYAHIPGGFVGPDYVQAGSDVTLSHAIDGAPEAVWA